MRSPCGSARVVGVRWWRRRWRCNTRMESTTEASCGRTALSARGTWFNTRTGTKPGISSTRRRGKLTAKSRLWSVRRPMQHRGQPYDAGCLCLCAELVQKGSAAAHVASVRRACAQIVGIVTTAETCRALAVEVLCARGARCEFASAFPPSQKQQQRQGYQKKQEKQKQEQSRPWTRQQQKRQPLRRRSNASQQLCSQLRGRQSAATPNSRWQRRREGTHCVARGL